MPGRISDADINNALDALFGRSVLVTPSIYWVGLSSTQPTNTGGNVSEPAVAGYARVGSPNDTTNWAAAAARSKANGAAVTFSTPTVSWGTVSYFVLYDDPSAGTMRAWGTLSTAVVIGIGTIASFAPGQLVINSPGA